MQLFPPGYAEFKKVPIHRKYICHQRHANSVSEMYHKTLQMLDLGMKKKIHLKSQLRHSHTQRAKAVVHERWPNDIFPGDEFSALDRVSPLRGTLQGDYKVQSFSCWGQFLCPAFAQLTAREIPRDMEGYLYSQQSMLDHMGFRSRISRNTLAYANKTSDRRMFVDFACAHPESS